MPTGKSTKGYALMNIKRFSIPDIVTIPNSLDFLYRRKTLTDKEHYQLVDWLAELIYEQREYVCQYSLGSINSKADFSGGFGPLTEYEIPEISGLPLSTRGVWFWKFHAYPPNEGFFEATVDGHKAEFRNEVDHVWGYTRDGFWSIATVSYLREHDYPRLGHIGHKLHRKILQVHTEKVKGPQEVSRIADVSASEVFRKLLLALEKWFQKRQELYETAKTVHDEITMVYNLLSRAR